VTGGDEEVSKKLDMKAYFRAGSAAYQLRDFSSAKTLFHCQLELALDDGNGRAMLQKTDTRLREEQHGDYAFDLITDKLSKANPPVHVADFTAKTEVKTSTGRGRGLFATIDIRAGELVLAEKAFCVPFPHEEQYFNGVKYNVRTGTLALGPSALWKEVVGKLHRHPSLLPKITALSGIWDDMCTSQTFIEGVAVIDSFQIHDIIVRNAYGASAPSKRQAKTGFGFQTPSEDLVSGLWCYASLINHACVSNTRRIFIRDLLVFRGARPIVKGEEITTAYSMSQNFDERQEEQEELWGFRCKCLLCVAESADPATVRKRKKLLEQETNTFIKTHQLRDTGPAPSSATVNKAEKLAKRIKDTYDAEGYAGVPRNAALRLQYRLIQARHDQRNGSECLAAVAEFFKLLAYSHVVVDEHEVDVRPGKGSVVTEEAVRAVGYAAEIMAITGYGRLAAKLEGLAREFYLIVNGMMDGFVGSPGHMLR